MKYIKAVGLAALIYLSGCAVSSKNHKAFNYEANKGGFEFYVRGKKGKDLTINFTSFPKEADTNLDGIIDKGEAKQYVANKFKQLKSNF